MTNRSSPRTFSWISTKISWSAKRRTMHSASFMPRYAAIPSASVRLEFPATSFIVRPAGGARGKCGERRGGAAALYQRRVSAGNRPRTSDAGPVGEGVDGLARCVIDHVELDGRPGVDRPDLRRLLARETMHPVSGAIEHVPDVDQHDAIHVADGGDIALDAIGG